MPESILVAAPADLLYAMVSDVPSAAAWTAETYRRYWIRGSRRSEVGATFRGWNRNGPFRWATTGCITVTEPNRCFAYRVTVLGFAVADWSYEITPTPPGCRVTQTSTELRNHLLRWVIAPMTTGVVARAARNQQNATVTLTRLKAAAEARHRSGDAPAV